MMQGHILYEPHLTEHLYYYKNQGCVFVCVSCLCRPPSHWWISFIFYTIIGLDPEGGQWLFKFKSNHNKKKIDKTQNSICETVVKNETVNIRIRILLLALKMKWTVQCSASDYTRHRYTPLNSMELRTLLSLPASPSVSAQLSRIHSRVRWFTHVSASVTRAHSNVFCGIVSTD